MNEIDIEEIKMRDEVSDVYRKGVELIQSIRDHTDSYEKSLEEHLKAGMDIHSFAAKLNIKQLNDGLRNADTTLKIYSPRDSTEDNK